MSREKRCTKCGDVLVVGENWYGSLKKVNSYICKGCLYKRNRLWKDHNHDKVLSHSAVARRRKGELPMKDNKKCSLFLGVCVAERVLRHVFNDVEVMPHGNPGYDIKCNHGKLIDVKSACMLTSDRSFGRWMFHIKKNAVAEYFLCLAFDNREYLNPLYIWLIPADVVNNLSIASISITTLDKWDDYKLDISKVSSCCDTIKNGGIHDGQKN